MLNIIKKMGILLLVLTVGGLVFVVVSGDELPPLQPPQNPQPSQEPVKSNPQEPAQQPPQPPQQPDQSKPQEPAQQPSQPPQEPIAPTPPASPQNVPQPPAPPSEKTIAKDEIWHAYREFQEVNAMLSNSKPAGEVANLENLAEQFYLKSEKLYEAGKYKESRVYAHLTIETLHGIRDILNGR